MTPAPRWVASLLLLAPAVVGAEAQLPPATSDEGFQERVKGLEEEVSDVSQRLARTQGHLLRLKEMVTGESLTQSARAVIVHRNQMGSSFRLVTASYTLDDDAIFTKVDVGGDLAGRDRLEVFNGHLAPGLHRIRVRLEYQGQGVGPITYLEGYRFDVTSSYTFDAAAGKVTSIQAIGYEKGGPFTEWRDQPAVEYQTEVQAAAPEARGPAPAP